MTAAQTGEKRRIVARRVLSAETSRLGRLRYRTEKRSGHGGRGADGDSMQYIAARDASSHAKRTAAGANVRTHLMVGRGCAGCVP
jgi:hypothetical protein